jgi:hypothetical protein
MMAASLVCLESLDRSVVKTGETTTATTSTIESAQCLLQLVQYE